MENFEKYYKKYNAVNNPDVVDESSNEITINNISRRDFIKEIEKQRFFYSNDGFFATKVISLIQNKVNELSVENELNRTWEKFKSNGLSAVLLEDREYLMCVAHLLGITGDQQNLEKQINESVNDMTMKKWRACILQNYQEYSESRALFLKVVEPKLRAKIVKVVKDNIDNGFLPIDEERLNTVINSVICTTQNLLSDTNGDYLPRTLEIRINILNFPTISDYDSDNLEKQIDYYMKIYCHEIIHALSGMTVIQEKDLDPMAISLKEFSGKPDFVTIYRTGLHIKNKFTWLDEGITEHLSQILLGQINADYLEKQSYEEEQNLFVVLSMITEIPEKDFLVAYFEDFDPTLPNKKGTPKVENLLKRINAQLFSKMNLSIDEIDYMVKKIGITKTIRSLQMRMSEYNKA